jgi:hypothetical protein
MNFHKYAFRKLPCSRSGRSADATGPMPSLVAGGLPQCVFPRLFIRARRSIFAGDVANVDKPDRAKVAQVLTSFLLTLQATTEAIMKYTQAIIALGLFGWLGSGLVLVS